MPIASYRSLLKLPIVYCPAFLKPSGLHGDIEIILCSQKKIKFVLNMSFKKPSDYQHLKVQ